MGLKAALEQLSQGKNKSYSEIAKYLLERRSYDDLKIKDISKLCHVSNATVTRFCQNLQFEGFADMKYHLMNGLWEDRRKFERSLREGGKGSAYQTVVTQACIESERMFSPEKRKRFLDLMENAKEIILIGLGTSALMAKDFEIRFARIGVKTRAIEDVVLQRFTLKNLDKDSLVIAFCYSGTTRFTMENLKIAKEREARTVLWTEEHNTQFENENDLVIYIHSHEPSHIRNSTSSRIAMMYLIDVLYFEMISKKNIHVEHYIDVTI